MNKHTPGPWRLDNNTTYWKTNPYSISTRKPGVHSVAIANIPARHTISRDEALANARLIAAAPELREALWAMVTSFHAVEYLDDYMKQASRKAREVLAKAEGRST